MSTQFQNFQNPLNARFEIAGPAQELLGVRSFVLQVVGYSLPEITLRSQQIALPPGNANADIPGTGVESGPLQVRALLDRDMHSWFYIANWIHAMSTDSGAKRLPQRKYLEGTILNIDILDNNRQPLYTFTFVDAFPKVLTDLEWDHQESTPSAMIFSVSIGYKRFYATDTKTGKVLFPIVDNMGDGGQ